MIVPVVIVSAVAGVAEEMAGASAVMDELLATSNVLDVVGVSGEIGELEPFWRDMMSRL